jgi:hypothetical protein
MMATMPKVYEQWTVTRHHPIEKLEPNLWRVEGMLKQIQRCMTIARLGDGRLVIHNAIALDPDEMTELEAWGKPAFLIVPSGMHRMDAKIWKARYPQMLVVCPPRAKSRVQQVVKVDTTEVDFGDPSVRYFIADGTAGREGVLEVHSPGGVTLVFNDLLANMRDQPGFRGRVFRALGFTGPEPKVPAVPRLLLVNDHGALRSHLERLSATPNLQRIIVGHGSLIHQSAAHALRNASARA